MKSKFPDPQPAASPARRHRWLLAAAIALEAAWLVLLAALAVLR
jgi:hypothetical protein